MMLYTLRANHKVYEISEHASERMRQRNVSEELIIATLEQGTLALQHHGVDRSEKEFEVSGSVRMIEVAVDETNRVIVTVIDITEGI